MSLGNNPTMAVKEILSESAPADEEAAGLGAADGLGEAVSFGAGVGPREGGANGLSSRTVAAAGAVRPALGCWAAPFVKIFLNRLNIAGFA
jgi:hypothetical protein